MNFDYEEFVSDFLETLKKIMPEADFERINVDKVNETRDAVRVQLPEFGPVMPTAYLDDLYQIYQKGNPIESIAKGMLQNMPEDVKKISEAVDFDKNTAWEKFFPCVVNKEMNEKLLADVPHKDIEGTDLTLIARFRIGDAGGQVATCIITNSNASALGMKPGEILEKAIANGARDKYVCKGLTETIAGEMRESGAPEEMVKEILGPGKKELCYMLSNEKMIQGAAVLGYPEEIKKATKNLGEENCYILPSSIHEVLLVPESLARGNMEELTDMVKTVNASEVRPEEQLSNHVYFFDGNILSIADTQTLGKKISNAPNVGKSLSKGANKQEKSKGPTR